MLLLLFLKKKHHVNSLIHLGDTELIKSSCKWKVVNERSPCVSGLT